VLDGSASRLFGDNLHGVVVSKGVDVVGDDRERLQIGIVLPSKLWLGRIHLRQALLCQAADERALVFCG
jgi:hypothetical protein